MPRYLLIKFGKSVKDGNTIIPTKDAISSNDKELQDLGKLGELYQKIGDLCPGDYAAYQEYLGRARSARNQVQGIDRETMESKLMEIVATVHKEGRLLEHDWTKAQLPQRLILYEREQRVTGLRYAGLRPGEEGNLTQREIDEANAKHQRDKGAG